MTERDGYHIEGSHVIHTHHCDKVRRADDDNITVINTENWDLRECQTCKHGW